MPCQMHVTFKTISVKPLDTIWNVKPLNTIQNF